MHLVRYTAEGGAPAVGVLAGERVAPTGYTDMLSFIAGGARAVEAAHAALADGITVQPERILAPLPNPGKMLFLGRSFRQFREDLPDEAVPFVYSRVPSSIIGPGEAIALPRPDARVLYEGELLIVIGRAARGVSGPRALDHVFGYTQVNDLTWTDWLHGDNKGLPQICLCKNADTFCPMGPSIATADELDPAEVAFTVTINGTQQTAGSTRDLVWTLPRILEFLSRDMTLQPGDVIATGTSDAQPIAVGDEVAVEFEGLGRLVNPVIAGWPGAGG
jgi:2-keto-4-pentenoate hydratase/2-oxohepta-3-ene-1,7-dioic acid hydratase in catechol pathway